MLPTFIGARCGIIRSLLKIGQQNIGGCTQMVIKWVQGGGICHLKTVNLQVLVVF